MHHHIGRATLVLFGLSAVALAACTPGVAPPPPPPTTSPPPPAWCQSEAAPSSASQVAVVDRGGSRPETVRFTAATRAQADQEVRDLGQHGRVLAVGPEALVHAVTTYPAGTNPDYASKQWDMQSGYVDYPGAWNATPSDTGSGTRVAIVDTGVEADHPDLAGQVVQGRDFVLSNETNSDYGRIDGDGHGTHVAGTVAAKDDTNGTVGGAFGATIVPARVLDCNGSGTNQGVADGVMWAADQSVNGGKAKVISLSLGSSSDSGGVLGAAIQYALGQGVTVVAAAGNAGQTSCNPAANTSPLYPAAYASDQTNYPGLIAVGATGEQTTARASYSNCNLYVTVAAPGTNIWSTYAQQPNHTPTYTYLSGTSMATPHVSAVAALVVAACPSDSPAQVRTRIITGTTAVTGFAAAVGMVDAPNAIAAC